MFWGTVIVLFLLGATGFIAYVFYRIVREAFTSKPAAAKKAKNPKVPLPCEDIWNNPDLTTNERDSQIAHELDDYEIRSPFNMTPDEKYEVLLYLERLTIRGRGFPCPKCKKHMGDELHQCGECGAIFNQKPIRVTRSGDGLQVEFVG